MSIIPVVAAVIRDEAGRVLLVRKRGTGAFMQPGGKREAGESDLAALAREIAEELSCRVVPASESFLGRFTAPAANEPGMTVDAAVYAVRVEGAIAPTAEIAECLWVEGATPGVSIAPLSALILRSEDRPRGGG